MMATFAFRPPHLGKDDPLGPVVPETVKKFGKDNAYPDPEAMKDIPLMTQGFCRTAPASPKAPKRDESLPELSAHNSYHHTTNLRTTRSVPFLRDWAGSWQQTLDNPKKDNLWVLPPQNMGVNLKAVWAGRPTDLREPWGERDGEEWNKRGIGVNLPLRVGAPARSGKIRSSAPVEIEPGVWSWRDLGAVDAIPMGPNIPNAHLIASQKK
jgi:hypothetical protein